MITLVCLGSFFLLTKKKKKKTLVCFGKMITIFFFLLASNGRYSCPIVVSFTLLLCFELVQLFIFLFTGLVLSGPSLPKKHQFVLARWGTTLSNHSMVMVMVIIIILWQGNKIFISIFKLSHWNFHLSLQFWIHTHTQCMYICFFVASDFFLILLFFLGVM